MPAPCQYFPFACGRYEVKAGLHRFNADFGNGQADGRIFQIDDEFDSYRAAKLAARSESLTRHVLTSNYPGQVATAAVKFIAQRLETEHPKHFCLLSGDGSLTLDCCLTNEQLVFDKQWQFDVNAGNIQASPPYVSAIDALACQIEEDLAVTCTEGDRHWLAALHVCFPSHWSPQDKIGRTFAQLHDPVPGMESMNRQESQFVDQMVHATDGLVRFVWGVQMGNDLNRHPDIVDAGKSSPTLQSVETEAFVRVERQTIWGLPDVGASLFTIRPYLYRVAELRPGLRRMLCSALKSMTQSSLEYKGLAAYRDTLVEWLNEA